MLTLTPKVLKKNSELQEFDPNLIYNSLLKETAINEYDAKKITIDVTKFVIFIGKTTKAITSPMIREIVNIILLKHGLELIRLQYTRIGTPKYDLDVKLAEINDLETIKLPFHALEQELIKEKITIHIFKENNEVNELAKRITEKEKIG